MKTHLLDVLIEQTKKGREITFLPGDVHDSSLRTQLHIRIEQRKTDGTPDRAYMVAFTRRDLEDPQIVVLRLEHACYKFET